MPITFTSGLTMTSGLSLLDAALLTGSIAFTSGQTTSVPDSAAFTFGTGDFTVEAWIYINTGQTQQYTVFDVGGAAAGSYALYWTAATQKFDSVRYGDTAGSGRTTNTYAANQWLHVAAVRSSGTAKLYINGIEDTGSTYAMGSVTAGAGISLTNTFASGSFNNGRTTNLRVVKGTAVYTSNFTPPSAPLTAITNTSLLMLASTSGTLFTDSSTNNFAVSGTATWNALSPFVVVPVTTGSIVFNGTTQYLSNTTNSTALQSGTGDFTIEFWMYPTSVASTSVVMELGRLSIGATAGIQLDVISNVLQIYYGSSVGSNLTGPTVTNNTWYHVALTRSSSSLRLFVNGVQAGSTVTDTTNYNQSYLWVASNAGGASALFAGQVTNLRVVKGVAVYTSNFAVSTTSLPTSQFANQYGVASAAVSRSQTALLLSAVSSGAVVTDSSINNFTMTNTGTATWTSATPFA